MSVRPMPSATRRLVGVVSSAMGRLVGVTPSAMGRLVGVAPSAVGRLVGVAPSAVGRPDGVAPSAMGRLVGVAPSAMGRLVGVASRRSSSALAMVLALSLVAGACEDANAPGPSALELRLDLRPLAGGAALGNAASVLARITLAIGLPNRDGSLITRDFTVTPTDSMVETTVDLSPGPYSFAVNAYSNNNTLIYSLTTVAFLGDGSDVLLIPQATDAVLVVGPADAGLADDLLIRNVGNRSLLWIADCVSAQTGSCDGSFFATPVRGTLAPGASATMRVCTFQSTATTFMIGFSSAVGTVTVRKAARPTPPGANTC